MTQEEPVPVEETPEDVGSPDTESVLADHNQAPPDLLWISEGSDFVLTTIYVYKDPKTRRLKMILVESAQGLKDAGLIEFPIETRWSVPSKKQLDDYREKSARFNHAARAVLVNRGMLEEMIIRGHLLEMHLGPEDSRTTVDLTRDRKGKLDNASMETINRLHPSVMDLILAKYVDEATLSL